MDRGLDSGRPQVHEVVAEALPAQGVADRTRALGGGLVGAALLAGHQEGAVGRPRQVGEAVADLVCSIGLRRGGAAGVGEPALQGEPDRHQRGVKREVLTRHEQRREVVPLAPGPQGQPQVGGGHRAVGDHARLARDLERLAVQGDAPVDVAGQLLERQIHQGAGHRAGRAGAPAHIGGGHKQEVAGEGGLARGELPREAVERVGHLGGIPRALGEGEDAVEVAAGLVELAAVLVCGRQLLADAQQRLGVGAGVVGQAPPVGAEQLDRRLHVAAGPVAPGGLGGRQSGLGGGAELLVQGDGGPPVLDPSVRLGRVVGGLAGGRAQPGRGRRIRAQREGGLDEPQRLARRAQRLGSLGGPLQHHRGEPDQLGAVGVGLRRGLERVEVVLGQQGRVVVAGVLLGGDVRGDGQVAGLAVAVRERVVGDLAND